MSGEVGRGPQDVPDDVPDDVPGGVRSPGPGAARRVARATVQAEEQLLGGERVLSRRQVAQGADVRLRDARVLWRALGLPNVESSVPAFTPADVDALSAAMGLVEEGRLSRDLVLGLARALGRTMDRLASWQVQVLLEETGSAEEVPRRVHELVAELGPLLDYTWRRHLASALDQLASDALARSEGPTVERSVGFADIVSFTSMTRDLSETALGALVQRFEETASDVVAGHGGRLIKTIGDEVVFACAPGASGAVIALDLVEAVQSSAQLPSIRVGVATGAVVSRMGDVFGTPVNRASRLTAIARPGTVLADDATAQLLATGSGAAATPLRERELRGLGTVRPWVVRPEAAGWPPAGTDVEGAAEARDVGDLSRLDGIAPPPRGEDD